MKYGSWSLEDFQTVLDKIGEQNARQILEGTLSFSVGPKTDPCFRIAVDYSRPFDDVLLDCEGVIENCSEVRKQQFYGRPYQTSPWWARWGEGVVSFDLFVVELSHVRFTKRGLDGAGEDLRRLGLEPARIEHLLALGRYYRYLAPQWPRDIHPLGSFGHDVEDCRYRFLPWIVGGTEGWKYCTAVWDELREGTEEEFNPGGLFAGVRALPSLENQAK